MDRIEALLGARPVPGGRHPAYGTHNALLSLGPTAYLEVIAPDPRAARSRAPLPFGLAGLGAPRLTRWALRSTRIEQDAEALGALGGGAVAQGSRATPDGQTLSWRLTDPRAAPLDGTLPFLIAWDGDSHPAATSPPGGELMSFRIEHPLADRVREALEGLGVLGVVAAAEAPALVATVLTRRGPVEVR